MGSSPSKQNPACTCKAKPGELPYEVFQAATLGHPSPILEYLKRTNVNVNATYKGETMLHAACANGRENVLTIILSQKGLCLNLRNDYNVTALMMAAEKGYRDCVEILLVHNHSCPLEFGCKNNDGKTACDLAHINNRQEVAYCLTTYQKTHYPTTGGAGYSVPPPMNKPGASPPQNKP